jgi:hypothetical protein
MTEVTVYYLEMTSPPVAADAAKPESFDVIEAMVKQYPVNQFLYQFIGENWSWLDKLSWSKEQWRDYVEVESLRTWIAYSQGSIAGYYELSQESEGSVEIAYFGLSPSLARVLVLTFYPMRLIMPGAGRALGECASTPARLIMPEHSQITRPGVSSFTIRQLMNRQLIARHLAINNSEL